MFECEVLTVFCPTTNNVQYLESLQQLILANGNLSLK